MLADIQAVVFDLDGTLLDRRRSFERFVRNQWQRFAHVLQIDRRLGATPRRLPPVGPRRLPDNRLQPTSADATMSRRG